MKVLQLITSTRSFFEQQVETLDDRGIDCTVLSVPGEYQPDSPRSASDYFRFYPRFLQELRSGDYDLVHANYGLVAPFALAQSASPVVLTLWGTDLMSDHGWLRAMSRYGARFSDAVVLPSPVMSAALDCDHTVIPFGVDTDLFRPIPRKRAREHLGWETDDPVVLFPYDPDRPEKNHSLAQAVVDEATVDAELRTVTAVPHEEMPYYMNASDALLITSERESGPMAVKEAAACNLPVVSTDVGFVRDVIDDVANSTVCDREIELVAALEYILENGSRSNGRNAIDDLGLETMGDQLVALYDGVLEQADANPRSISIRGTHNGT
jgi:glycosyltransferase involved in cell wall biosynthesis